MLLGGVPAWCLGGTEHSAGTTAGSGSAEHSSRFLLPHFARRIPAGCGSCSTDGRGGRDERRRASPSQCRVPVGSKRRRRDPSQIPGTASSSWGLLLGINLTGPDRTSDLVDWSREFQKRCVRPFPSVLITSLSSHVILTSEGISPWGTSLAILRLGLSLNIILTGLLLLLVSERKLKP